MSENRHPYQEIVARAWTEPAFKQRLQADPKAVLLEYGYDPSFEGAIEVHENDERTFFLVIPSKPGPLSENDLDQVAGGAYGEPGPAPPPPPPGYGGYGYTYPYPTYPYPYPAPYGSTVIVGSPNYTPGPMLLNGSWHM